MLGVIASSRPEHEGFDAYLDHIVHPKLKGLRRILHTLPDELMENSLLRDHLRLLPARDLSFDLCVLQRQLPLVRELITACPDTRFVLDHCGVPDISGDGWKSWGPELRKVAELPNVACKVSGIVAYANKGQLTADALRPYVETSIEAFGWDRVVWGGDWPVCTLTSSLHQWITILDEILASEAPTNQTRLFQDNARDIYRLDR